MKFQCRVDGVHFPQDFEQTLKPPCNFWGDVGFSNLDKELKKKFWDWLFSMPSDEIAIKTNIGVSLEFKTVPIKEDSQFINVIPGYADWTEKEQQDFQKEYFIAVRTDVNITQWIKDYVDGKKQPERLLN